MKDKFTKLKDLIVTSKVVLLRCDLNVPIKNGEIQDMSRIRAILPTLNYLCSSGAKVLLISHFGDPFRETLGESNRDHTVKVDTENGFEEKFSLKQVLPTLEALTGLKIHFPTTIISHRDVVDAIEGMNFGEVAMFENIRFDPREKKNDIELAKVFAQNINFFVNDAFSVSHRKHALIDAIARLCVSCPGFAFEKEMNGIDSICKNVKSPACAIVGGAKISTKIKILVKLTQKMDYVVIGGAMANTMLKFKGHNVGSSLVEDCVDDLCKMLVKSAEKSGCKLILPEDVVLDSGESVKLGLINGNSKIYDIGVRTSDVINKILLKCRTCLINGPLGMYEEPLFAKGTLELISQVDALTKAGKLKSIAGGGDILACINIAKQKDGFTFISTSGGAFLDYVANETLPGIEALEYSKLHFTER